MSSLGIAADASVLYLRRTEWKPSFRSRTSSSATGTFTAVQGISFAVEPGECFGILGPNGAGKSSTFRILTAFSPATSGSVTVDGIDVARRPREVKARLGVVPQEENLDTDLPVLQNLLVYSRYFRMPQSVALANSREALAFFELADRENDKVDTLSGGMKRRLNHRPGAHQPAQGAGAGRADHGAGPAGAPSRLAAAAGAAAAGITTILSTHNMEEATALCQRLVIMDHGQIIAAGSPSELVRSSGGREVVEVRPPLGELASMQARLTGLGLQVERAGTALLAYSSDGVELERQLASEGMQVLYRTANLEDMFLRLTGRSFEEEE